MRRPLVWVVVSISLWVLFASRMSAEPEAVSPSSRTSLIELPATKTAQSLFAYVREDGSLQFLPLANGSSGELESGHARQFEGEIAVYTWSTPVVASAPRRLERQALQ